MSSSLNRSQLMGNLGADPKIHEFDNGGKVVNFPLATSESWKDKRTGEKVEHVTWHNIKIYNEALGEIASRYLKKGDHVYLEGQIENRSYVKNEETRYASEIALRGFDAKLKMLPKAQGNEAAPSSEAAPEPIRVATTKRPSRSGPKQ